MYSDIQLREIFHFCFLERLLRISGPELYVLKGGVNLRFFFNSPRYSEDMDLDIVAGSPATLKKNGYKILEDPAFMRSLRTYGIESLDINDPQKAKHTETTQRFRVGLVKSSGLRLPTKVEFSRRGKATDAVTETIDPEIARPYRKLAFRCRHYPGAAAATQKIQALAGRATTQARDVFDLYLLYTGGHANMEVATNVPAPTRRKASEAALSLSFADFQGQVLEFLDPANRAEHGSKQQWEAMQETVLGLLDDA